MKPERDAARIAGSKSTMAMRARPVVMLNKEITSPRVIAGFARRRLKSIGVERGYRPTHIDAFREEKSLALSIVNATTAPPAHHGFNSPAPFNGSPQQASGVSSIDAGDRPAVIAPAVSADAGKPATHLAGATVSALGPDAGGIARFATNPVSTGPAAATAFDYAKAIAAYTRQSGAPVASPSSIDITPEDAAMSTVGVMHAAISYAGQANRNVAGPDFHVPRAAGSIPQAMSQNAGGVVSTENSDAGAQTTDATPPGDLLQAGGQAHPIAAPTSHAVMSLLKMI
jgi:hypothetical protein